MDKDCLHFEVNKKDRDAAIKVLHDALVDCRTREGFPNNTFVFDDDVCVYLAHLLFAFSMAEYHEMAEPYISLDSRQIMQWAEEAEDITLRYFIFKVNADHILIHGALLNDLGKKPKEAPFKSSQKYYREIAKLYYEQAALTHRQIHQQSTGISEVLGKMTTYFEIYQTLLRRFRFEYFRLLNNFRDQAFCSFINELNDYELNMKKEQLTDQFLDLYNRWLSSHDAEVESKMKGVVQEIQKVDPGFHFNLKQ